MSTLTVSNINGNPAINASSMSIGSNAVTPFAGFKNKIINGNFDFWQRGTSVTGITSGQYLADRWASNRTGTTANVSRQSFTLGQTDVPGEPTYFHRSVVTSVAGAGNFYSLSHSIEFVRTLAGQTATLSFWAKADASKNIAVEFIQFFGTGGSPSSEVNTIGVTTCALTTSWQKFTITANIPSISGKTLGTDNNDRIITNFWFDAGSNINSRTNSLGQQSGTFDIAQVQVEAGSVATPFEMRPLQAELALCQRYFEKSYSQATAPGSATGLNSGEMSGYYHPTSNFRYYVPFKVTKRASGATITTYDAAGTGGTGTSAKFSYYTTTWNNGGSFAAAQPSAGDSGFYVGHNQASAIETQFAWTADREF